MTELIAQVFTEALTGLYWWYILAYHVFVFFKLRYQIVDPLSLHLARIVWDLFKRGCCSRLTCNQLAAPLIFLRLSGLLCGDLLL